MTNIPSHNTRLSPTLPDEETTMGTDEWVRWFSLVEEQVFAFGTTVMGWLKYVSKKYKLYWIKKKRRENNTTKIY
jgi:hypothetical protein